MSNRSLSSLFSGGVLVFQAMMAGAGEHEGGGARSTLPCSDSEIVRYRALRAGGPLTIDGHLDEWSWKNATPSPRYVDILTGRPTIHETRATILWDDERLYIGIRVEEPFVRAKYTENERGALLSVEGDAVACDRRAVFAAEGRGRMEDRSLAVQPVQGGPAGQGFRGLGAEPASRVGFAHPGMFSLCPVLHEHGAGRGVNGVGTACGCGSWRGCSSALHGK